ncbi:B-cadherin-like isoform X2 [Eleginops maclovinus]|uniref:B-cadherin-like isoform X2 n=1 Tax=Eleginops maclovinus TaxID=56733 RepID=UPI0030807915
MNFILYAMDKIRPALFFILCLVVPSSSLEILNRQKRDWIIDSFSIDEDYDGSYPYNLGVVRVEKKFSVFMIHGQGVDIEPKNILQIHEDTGLVTVHGPVDYENFKVLKLTFQAFDRKKKEIDTQLAVEIIINDANDNPPKFEPDRYEVTIEESKLQGSELLIIKASDDDSNEQNRLFDFKIISVIPEPTDLEFYLTQVQSTATISFKGCLDHEGTGSVKEGQENVLVKRVQVTDQDEKGSSAWRAIYQIEGDENGNFKITTDPETNEGLLYVEKPLDYEDSHEKHLKISVQNEVPYFSCKVQKKYTAGLWDVITIGGGTGKETAHVSTTEVTVIVEDVNDPPIFDLAEKHVTVAENTKAGFYLATFTATDHDTSSANTFVYTKADDPADWITVDPKTGNITTTKIIDRESSFVKDNIYKVAIYAVDNGVPPLTGTATLNIHIIDENDNVPQLTERNVDICQSDKLSWANITAFDLDQDPYGGPFSFKLLEKEKGKWKFDRTQGYTTNLVKEHTIHSGEYDLVLEVSDLQGEKAVYNLSVVVCNCVDITKPNCRNRKAKVSVVGEGALGIIFLSMLLLAAMLLLIFLLQCTKEPLPMPPHNDSSLGQLIQSNIEKPGTDCQVNFGNPSQNHKKFPEQPSSDGTWFDPLKRPEQRDPWYWLAMEQKYRFWYSWQKALALHDGDISALQHTNIRPILQQKLYALSAPEEELGDYDAQIYAEEGDDNHIFDLDAISIPDIAFDQDLVLDYRFNTLASVCRSSKSTAYSTKLDTQSLKKQLRSKLKA